MQPPISSFARDHLNVQVIDCHERDLQFSAVASEAKSLDALGCRGEASAAHNARALYKCALVSQPPVPAPRAESSDTYVGPRGAGNRGGNTRAKRRKIDPLVKPCVTVSAMSTKEERLKALSEREQQLARSTSRARRGYPQRRAIEYSTQKAHRKTETQAKIVFGAGAKSSWTLTPRISGSGSSCASSSRTSSVKINAVLAESAKALDEGK